MIVMVLYSVQPRSSQEDLNESVPRLLNNLTEGLLPKPDQYVAGVKSIIDSFSITSNAAHEIWKSKPNPFFLYSHQAEAEEQHKGLFGGILKK